MAIGETIETPTTITTRKYFSNVAIEKMAETGRQAEKESEARGQHHSFKQKQNKRSTWKMATITMEHSHALANAEIRRNNNDNNNIVYVRAGERGAKVCVCGWAHGRVEMCETSIECMCVWENARRRATRWKSHCWFLCANCCYSKLIAHSHVLHSFRLLLFVFVCVCMCCIARVTQICRMRQ